MCVFKAHDMMHPHPCVLGSTPSAEHCGGVGRGEGFVLKTGFFFHIFWHIQYVLLQESFTFFFFGGGGAVSLHITFYISIPIKSF